MEKRNYEVDWFFILFCAVIISGVLLIDHFSGAAAEREAAVKAVRAECEPMRNKPVGELTADCFKYFDLRGL